MDPTLLILIAAVLFFACMLQGITGFGQSLMAVPILMLFMSPLSVAPLMLLAGSVLNMILAVNSRRHIQLTRFWPLIIGGIAGVPFGMALLLMLPPGTIKVVMGLLIVIFSILLLVGFSVQVKNEGRAFFPVGLVSGVLNGSVTMSGPPVILFFTNQQLGKEEFRANLIVYFMILNLFTIPVFYLGGLFNSEITITFLVVVPVIIIASVLGGYLSRKLPQTTFRAVALIIVLLAGVSAFISGLSTI